MQKITTPNVLDITNLQHIPNFGIPATTHELIRGRVADTLQALKTEGYTITY